jgi:glutaconate CoA-transferase subunit B
MADLFGLYLQRGLVEVALLGGAQIDRFGNLNTTVIGDYKKPKTRLPGSGGACEIAINAQRTFMIMRLKRRAFVDKLDFLTSPGHLTGGDSRARLDCRAAPELVITDKAILNFDNPQREMQLSELYPGVTVKDVQAEVGWELRLAATIGRPPDQRLRSYIDPR